MIDAQSVDLIESPEVRGLVKRALATLAESGVIQLQLNAEFVRLAAGNSEDSVESLAQDILAYRSKSQNLLTLEQLGEKYAREIES